MTTRTLRVALAGNPNSGKTSIFNALTGAHQRVGNYPGVTVERREGRFVADDGQVFEVLDLPGTYSLSSYSPEERIAEEELLKHGADVIALVVDSTALERSLVLVTQLLQLGVKPVLCLNMADEAKRAGQELDLPLLERRLGFPVIETVAHRAIGIDALRDALARVGRQAPKETPLIFGDPLDGALARITEALEPCQGLAERGHPWIASRLLADDPAIRAWVLAEGDAGQSALTLAAKERHVLEGKTGVDTPLFLMQRRQAFVQALLDGAIKKPARADARHVSDAVDRVLVNRVLGLPIFLAIMYGLFWVTFTVGEIPMKWIEHGTQALALWVSALWPLGSESALRSLLVDGVISGVGAVLIFVPNIMLLFWGLSLLENTGYMARAAFLMDRVLHRFGLHGRSFLPLMTGFGCSIPGIMATRTLENEKDRLTTIL
ncbi:MAG: ferrous iron transport protein B, partial [Deltaproteobacteria bacterium]|nr:ferrous iron transport protein B [Deltaproteobacteria bacterium]